MSLAVTIGVLAATGSTVSFAPQAWKILQTQEAKDISAAMYTITLCAFGLWVVYGILISKWPIIAPNAICFVLSAFILTAKFMSKAQLRGLAKLFGLARSR